MSRLHDAPPTPEDVHYAYRLLLGRAPESTAAVEGHLRQKSLRDLLRVFLSSPEFRSTLNERAPAPPNLRLKALLQTHHQPAPKHGDPAYWTDLLGVRHRADYRRRLADSGGRHFSGTLGEPLEWLSLLEALEAGGDGFTAVELGAGYGPWLSRAGIAWRRWRPGARLRLIGVEGEPTHFAWLRCHLADNGLMGPDVELHEAAVTAVAGNVGFPVADDPAFDWGTSPAATAAPPADQTHGRWRTVPGLALGDLLAREPRVDFLHLDIQGGELQVLTAAATSLCRVDRICVGTHGRDLEAGLLALLPTLGFRLEAEEPCHYQVPSDLPLLLRDGTQYWVNRAPRESPNY